jgi:signal transduction histidine kinase
MSERRKRMLKPAVDEIDDLAKRLEFLALTNDDARRLRETGPAFDAVADSFVEQFYAHLFAFEQTARFLKDAAVVEALKRTQKEHFRTMFDACWDDAFVQQRRQVGRAHADIGIEPQFFLGAYNQFLSFYLSNLCPVGKVTTHEDIERIRSMLKAIFLDVGLSLDAYFRRLTEDLQRALGMLWEANKELKQFAHFTSHDLKTPLGTVANLCDEVIDEFGSQIPGEARRLIESARHTAYRMSTMIDELLSLSSPFDDELAEEPISTETVLAEAIERVSPELKRKNIEVVLPAQYPRVVGKRIALREVFFNLFSNAAKYIERPAGRIIVGAKVAERRCVLSVADNGPGIPADELHRIFAPFHRLKMHQNTDGCGLGLYFAKSLVEQQDGRIWVESRLGEGSCFFVSLKHAAETGSVNGTASLPQ